MPEQNSRVLLSYWTISKLSFLAQLGLCSNIYNPIPVVMGTHDVPNLMGKYVGVSVHDPARGWTTRPALWA
jgi:hypothetical protein